MFYIGVHKLASIETSLEDVILLLQWKSMFGQIGKATSVRFLRPESVILATKNCQVRYVAHISALP